MKKFFSIIVVFLFSAFLAFSQAAAEESRDEVNLGVMQGPTGFSSSQLEDFINVFVLSSPNEAIAKMVNGELDMAVVPANSALALYNKGVEIKAVAVVGEGMLSVIGTDADSKTISVPGAGGTPDHMARLLFPQYEEDYSVTAPAQLAQLLIAGKSKLAILPQPFVNMVLAQNSDMKILYNVQSEWESLTGYRQFPMSILIVSSGFAQEHSALLYRLEQSYRLSVEKVNSDPEAAAKRIEELGIMAASMAQNAIKDCALVYKDAEEAKGEVTSYFEVLLKLAPDAIGGAMPLEDFWI